MMKTPLLAAATLAAAALAPQIASADFVLDTGTPPAPGAIVPVLNTTDWYAEEFSLGAGQTVTSLSAYLTTAGTSIPGTDTVTFDLFSGANFTGNAHLVTLATTNATFQGTGWTTGSLSYTAPTTGDYWVAIEVTSAKQTHGIDIPSEASTSSGTVPALAFATSTGHAFTLSQGDPVGMEVSATAAPVPLPAAVWLLGSGLAGLGALVRRTRP